MRANVVLQFVSNETEQKTGGAGFKKLFQLVFSYVLQHKLVSIIGLFIIICLSIFQVLIPQIARYSIDIIIPEKNIILLPWIATAILLVAIFRGILDYFRIYLMSLFGQKIVEGIRRDLYQHVQKLSMSFFENHRTGDLMSRLAENVNTISTLISSDLSEISVDVFTVLAIIIYFLSVSWQLALLLVVTWPLQIYVTQVFSKFIQTAYMDVEHKAAEINNQIQDTLSNINAIKSFGNEKYETDRFSEQSRNYMEVNVKAIRLWSIFVPTTDTINIIASLIILVVGSWEVIADKLTIGEFTAFFAYANQVSRPILRFSKVTNILQKAIASSDRIFAILDIEPEIKERENAINLTSVRGRMRFENVNFAYHQGKTVLHDFNLDIQPGMTVALVGSSGSGKSTIAKLAARFYDPKQGRILMDEYDLRDISLGSLRSHLGIVSQETLLLYGTIRDNIVYGKLDATDAEIEAAAKAANAHNFIMSFPNGYNSIVGERGVKLSGGQRQRLAIARVLVKNPQFVILDEATSALDTESEKLIQESLTQLLKGRTSLVIAHRLSTIQNTDLIVVLEGGKIVEMGTHKELIDKGGRYLELQTLQLTENLPTTSKN
ncbi:ABC transporter ATP-binding protein [Cylindrospermopsis raciborskii]|jgi:subfamily B ATP-binding cassette protein MsbA|uniref:ABC transporter ATP-binding protein n=1 Tax=Cylindrospermopsis raciborskii TaxID=77022 RepID=UPI001F15E3BB|nr:ABC transporter ATP-binding protein [Cylindrospermopsis raciborskii]UJS04457.1 ABC transporter ATP-binding protein/permease [Cylindrospermopsis raciborskii KLL07]